MHKLLLAALGCCTFGFSTLGFSTLVFSSLWAPPLHAAEEPITSVQDLRYGVVLYDFYQDDYFQALTELLLGEQEQDMPHHAEFAHLLRGGISLSYGMDAQARNIFEELLAQHPKPNVRDRAWFYLGKSYYERGEADNAVAMFARGGDNLPRRLRQERDYLRANIALQRGDLAAAQLATPEQSSSEDEKLNPWFPYLLFNRGVLQSRQGDAQGAANSFAQLSALPLREEEHKSLRDRAFTASGYTYLGAQQPQAALDVFRQVRLNSPFADKALLGYGWAAAQTDNFELALQPWQELNQRSLLSPAVQEGLLAVPYAYEKLGAPAQALAEYQRAEQLYAQEITRIDDATTTLQKTSLLNLWLDPKAKEVWLSRHEELPVAPQLPYLEHLLALNPIQEVLKDMRDLGVLEQYLDEWRDRLSALDESQALQYQRRQQALKTRPDQVLIARLDALQEQRDHVAAQLEKAKQTTDGTIFMEAKDIATWKRLERVQRNIDVLKLAGKDVHDAEQKYQRYRGLLYWDLQEKYSARRWTLTKELRAIDMQLAKAQLEKATIGNLVERAHAPEQGERIRGLNSRLQATLQNIHMAQSQGDKVLRERAVAELEVQRERLVAYLSRAKLEKARLLDKGTTEALQ
jgi:hypothetical protein